MNRKRKQKIGVTLLAGLAACLLGGATYADEVVVGNLESIPATGVPGLTPQKIKLSSNRPAAIKNEPTYRGKPLYGTITLGNTKNSSDLVVLDTFPEDTHPHLYVDVAGTGDFSTVKPILLAASRGAFGTHSASDTPSDKATISYSGVAPTVARYDFKGSVREDAYPVQFTFSNGNLSYVNQNVQGGKLTINGRTYRIALVALNGNGVYNKYNHDDMASPLVSLLIDRNNDGHFDPKRETFDLAKPFRLAGSAYEVADIDSRGTVIALRKTDKRAEGTITAADLRDGSDVIDFSVKMLDGKTVNFPDDFKHKVVMLDFWAMWCGPCLAEMPNVVAVYNQYHQYGFEILGVSLDRANQKDQLIAFLPQYNMSWPQIYDGGYWKAEIAVLYGVEAIPHEILVDGDTGTIIAMGDELRGAGLEPAVAKALSKKRH